MSLILDQRQLDNNKVASVGSVNLKKDDWRAKSFCRCRSFQKEYVCKHVIGLAIRLGLAYSPWLLNVKTQEELQEKQEVVKHC